MKVIDLEQHFETPMWIEALKHNNGYPRFDDQKGLGYWEDSWIPNTKTGANEKLLDLGEGRLRLMDECGIDYAQLSLTSPGSESFPVEISKKIAEDANNKASEAIEKYPERFGAYMTLAPKDPEWSLKEIDRCLKMGLWGWHTHSNYGDAYLDEKRFWPILERCEELDMPIYIHPAATTAKELRTFGICLAAPTFGFGVDTQYCFLRMIHRGVFDAFPNLKIILGHFGECFPFTVDRINAAYRQGYGMPLPEIGGGYEHEPGYYVKKNLWTTSSGNYLKEALYCTRDVLGMDRVTMGTDHPYEKMNLGVDMMMKDVPLTDEEKSAFLFENARKLGFGKNL